MSTSRDWTCVGPRLPFLLGNGSRHSVHSAGEVWLSGQIPPQNCSHEVQRQNDEEADTADSNLHRQTLLIYYSNFQGDFIFQSSRECLVQLKEIKLTVRSCLKRRWVSNLTDALLHRWYHWKSFKKIVSRLWDEPSVNLNSCWSQLGEDVFHVQKPFFVLLPMTKYPCDINDAMAASSPTSSGATIVVYNKVASLLQLTHTH